MNIRTGIIQFDPILGSPAGNIRRLNALFNRLDECELIVLPELSSSGYNFISAQQAFESSESLDGGEFCHFILEMAATRNAYIVAGVNEREGKNLFNTAILAGPEGMIGKYRKIHLFMNEKDIFQPGDKMPEVYQLNGFRTGIQICFDYLFPEPWRYLSEKGADIVCHPSNLITENAYRTLPAQALMNRVFIVTANRTGTDRDLSFCGKSVVYGTRGEVLYMSPEKPDDVAVVNINPLQARDKKITSRNHVFTDRREDLY